MASTFVDLASRDVDQRFVLEVLFKNLIARTQKADFADSRQGDDMGIV